MDFQINEEEKILMSHVIYYHNQNSKYIRVSLTNKLGLQIIKNRKNRKL